MAYRYGNDPEYREQVKQRARERYAALTPEQKKRHNSASSNSCRLARHNMTKAQFLALLYSQGWRCAICRSDQPGRKPGKHSGPNQSWHIDHDHRTGVVRGLLCHGCNVALGGVKDSQTTLQAMIEYLERAKSLQTPHRLKPRKKTPLTFGSLKSSDSRICGKVSQ